MRFEWQNDEFCIVPTEREHKHLYEAVELTLDGAATGGAPLTPDQAEAYLAYHRLGLGISNLPIGVDQEDLQYLTDCLADRAIDLSGEGSYDFANKVVAQMRRALGALSRKTM